MYVAHCIVYTMSQVDLAYQDLLSQVHINIRNILISQTKGNTDPPPLLHREFFISISSEGTISLTIPFSWDRSRDRKK